MFDKPTNQESAPRNFSERNFWTVSLDFCPLEGN
jgi:hypothetical protein